MAKKLCIVKNKDWWKKQFYEPPKKTGKIAVGKQYRWPKKAKGAQ